MAHLRNTFKLLALVAVSAGLFSFALARNTAKPVASVAIRFKGEQRPFLKAATVNKLLIQNYPAEKKGWKDGIVLKTIEDAVKANPMVKDAQVFRDVRGTMTVEVTQRTPVARIENGTRYYLDDTGVAMPLSSNFTARVPLVTGPVSDSDHASLHRLMQAIGKDTFLAKALVGVELGADRTYRLRLRAVPFPIHVGRAEDLPSKFRNFKAFYRKAKADGTLGRYAAIDLDYRNQVVCKKIEGNGRR